MTQRIVYQGDDGVAKVVCPSPSFLASGRPLSSLKGRPTDGRPERVVDESEIESDRTFRNAWELDEAGEKPCKVNMTKALGLAQERVRRARGPKLAELDTEYIRADEAKDNAKKSEVAQKKQQLRDAPDDPRLSSASTPEELKANMEAIESEIEAFDSKRGG